MGYEPDLTLAEARAIIARAVAKARQLKQVGAFAVLDAGGNLISLSRMGDAPISSAWVARAKAYLCAVVQLAPSLRRAPYWDELSPQYVSFQRLSREEIFPEPGARAIWKGDRIVGAVAAGGIGPWTEIPGVDRELLRSRGKSANAEDLIIADALQIPYDNHHGELGRAEGPRIEERMDDLPHSLDTARRYAESAMECAREQGHHVGVAIVDELGRLMEAHRMDGGTLMSPDVAEAKALTALNFLQPSRDFVGRMGSDIQAGLRSFVHFNLHFVAGGVTIVRDGYVVGALGLSHGGGTLKEDEMGRRAVSRVDGSYS